MTRLAWLTDIHLNFVTAPQRCDFFEYVLRQGADALLVTGDIAESHLLEAALLEMAGAVQLPIYFVLGNHDFYRGSIADTRRAAASLRYRSEYLFPLPDCGIVPLAPGTALMGHEGWGDARLGDFERSEVILNDYLLIEDLRHWQDLVTLDRQALQDHLHRLGDESAAHFDAILPEALDRYAQIVVATHVPPFAEVCRHNGRPADEQWLPHFSCDAVGRVLCEHMRRRPERRMLVLCGHTHGDADVQILDNLHVVAGGAEYGRPCVQRVLELE